MNTRKMNTKNQSELDCCIETELKDILTLNSCSTLLSELIKFILYRKQQLPYTFDRLKYLITKRHTKDKQESTNKIPASVEKQFKLAEDGLTTLELLFEKTKEELAGSKSGGTMEVALVFGSTPMTPKQVYWIHLPEISRYHSPAHHPERKHLIHLLQSVILSNNLSDMLKKPLNPTNMYVFIRKNNSCKIKQADNLNKWFIPKNKYDIPKTGQHFHIKFKQPHSYMLTCACQDFKIYSDQEETPSNAADTDLEELEAPAQSAWFQACATFKGFTDVYINGVSVADLWLR